MSVNMNMSMEGLIWFKRQTSDIAIYPIVLSLAQARQVLSTKAASLNPPISSMFLSKMALLS